jgi:putative glutamine amidotransferase
VSRPAIAITVSSGPGRYTVRDDYVRAVEDAGGLPLAALTGPPEAASALLDRVDGLLLTGGGDVDPACYGQPRHRTTSLVYPERDAFEIALLRGAIERDRPLLAICRGVQVLNVALGGTLVQDIPSEVPGSVDHHPGGRRWAEAHRVQVVPGTLLHRILGEGPVAVNSIHHQAVRDLGRGTRVCARSEGDSLVEGLEVPDRRFVLGVQWHPESFWDHGGRFRPLFESLVQAASRP